MIGDGVLDDLEQFLLRIGGADREPMQKLDHEASKTLECTRNSNTWIHFDQDTFGRVNVNLEFACLVDRGVEQSEKTLHQV